MKKNKILILIAIAFLIYCVILLIKLWANPTNTFIVEQGKIYNEETTEGYIIRKEEIIENDSNSGKIIQLKAEGEKVANGEAVYRYASTNEEELNKKISELDEQIQDALKSENTLFSTDIKLLENQIEQQLGSIYERTNVKEIEQYKKNIDNELNKKTKIEANLAKNGSYVKQLIEERSNCQNQVNSNSKYVYSNKSGILSYKVDNLESTLVTGDFSYLNKDFLNSLNLKRSQIIASNNQKAKIVDNFNCYIASIFKSEEAKNSEVGNYIKIRLPNSDEIQAKIVYKSDQGDNQTLLVFEIEKDVEKLISYRKIMYDVIWWSDSGIKIPNSAIEYDGNFAYVERNRAGYTEKVLVKVLRQNDNYAIVENYSTAELESLGYNSDSIDVKKSISLYDEILINKK